MKCKVEILPFACEDLKKIEDSYILQFDVQTALKVSDHILDTIEHLKEFPDSGSATPDDWLNEQGYRMIICKKHVAIYWVIHETVYIYISYRRYRIRNWRQQGYIVCGQGWDAQLQEHTVL